ncbi:hypothetical protein [Algoriphagus winogradskyi]|jgi:hypothetical protein|uniref:Anti-sigma factor n=1 Tax=Algoriphagus winogradskyi TaxID=237017 RepID=A0ABY1P881_9BACT|nr:hypothetical protein [Algoriphagus winogradskyi]SMP28220.1 hypothetical protein SAMN06265367_105289 [Algoriphagus winogradskyi]
MNQRIDELLEKYWEAETTLAEEQELKELLQAAEGYTEEKILFSGINELTSEEPTLKMPTKTVPIKSRNWMNWAASVAILVGSVWGWTVYEQKQAEEEAYMEVMQAFALIQTNLSKGQEEMGVMNEMRYLNTTNQLFGNPINK